MDAALDTVHGDSIVRSKVLWITSSYPRFEGDSASVFLRHLASAIQREKIDLHVLAPDHLDVDQSLSDKGINLHHFRYFLPRNRQQLAYGFGILPNLRSDPWLHLQIPFFIGSMFLATGRLLRKIKPEIIHAQWLFPQGTIAVCWGKLLGLPVIITTHGGDVFGLQGSLLGCVKRWTINHCTAWTSNTLKTAEGVGSDLPSAHVIPMGVNFEQFHTNHSETLQLNKKPNSLVLLFVGRLAEKKGVKDLIEAYSLLPEPWRNKTELWIVGDGEKRELLEKQAIKLGVNRKVKFFGRIPNEQLQSYYSSSSVFIAPSIVDSQGDTEGQGVVLLEAMACNLPIISTRVGGIEDVIRDGENGILTEPKQPEQLKNAIVRLLEDAPLREKLKRNGSNHVKAYEWKRIGKKFADLYQYVLNP